MAGDPEPGFALIVLILLTVAFQMRTSWLGRAMETEPLG